MTRSQKERTEKLQSEVRDGVEYLKFQLEEKDREISALKASIEDNFGSDRSESEPESFTSVLSGPAAVDKMATFADLVREAAANFTGESMPGVMLPAQTMNRLTSNRLTSPN